MSDSTITVVRDQTDRASWDPKAHEYRLADSVQPAIVTQLETYAFVVRTRTSLYPSSIKPSRISLLT